MGSNPTADTQSFCEGRLRSGGGGVFEREHFHGVVVARKRMLYSEVAARRSNSASCGDVVVAVAIAPMLAAADKKNKFAHLMAWLRTSRRAKRANLRALLIRRACRRASAEAVRVRALTRASWVCRGMALPCHAARP